MKELDFNIDGIYPLNKILELQGMSESDDVSWFFEFIGVDNTFDLAKDQWAQNNQENGDHLAAFLHTGKIYIPEDEYEDVRQFFKEFHKEHCKTNNPTEIVGYYAGVLAHEGKSYDDLDEDYKNAIEELAHQFIFTDADFADLKENLISLNENV